MSQHRDAPQSLIPTLHKTADAETGPGRLARWLPVAGLVRQELRSLNSGTIGTGVVDYATDGQWLRL